MQLLHLFVIFQNFSNFANFHVFRNFSTESAYPIRSHQLLFSRPGDPPSDGLWVVNQTFTKHDMVYSDFVVWPPDMVSVLILDSRKYGDNQIYLYIVTFLDMKHREEAQSPQNLPLHPWSLT